jgi:hypothetical protein
MILAVAGLLLTLVQAAPAQTASVTGTWDGTLTGQKEDGSPSTDTALLILVQKDKTITGTVGGNLEDQFPITSGTIDGNKITLVAKKDDGREFNVELTIQNDELTGTVASGPRNGKLQAHRHKE